MKQPKDPKRPTLAYLESVLKSENIMPTTSNVRKCWRGWLSAVNDGSMALEKARSMDADFWAGDAFSIGYTTYTYGYGIEESAPVNLTVEQARLFPDLSQ